MIFQFTILLFSALPSYAAQAAGARKPPTYFSYLFQPKLIVMLVLGLLAFWLLKTKKMKDSIKVPFLLFSTFLFGLVGNIALKPFSYFFNAPITYLCFCQTILIWFTNPIFGYNIGYIFPDIARAQIILRMGLSGRCAPRADRYGSRQIKDHQKEDLFYALPDHPPGFVPDIHFFQCHCRIYFYIQWQSLSFEHIRLFKCVSRL